MSKCSYNLSEDCNNTDCLNCVLDHIKSEIVNHLQIMDIYDVKKVNGIIVQSESVNRKVVLYDSVMQIIDKYKTGGENK